MESDFQQNMQERAVLVGLNADCFTKEQIATDETLEELKAIREAVQIPIVAIGGVNEENIALLKETGVDGAAVISAVVGQKDITAAAERLISNFREA